jgi:hypothetical protein
MRMCVCRDCGVPCPILARKVPIHIRDYTMVEEIWWWTHVAKQRCPACRAGYESSYLIRLPWVAMEQVYIAAAHRITESAIQQLNPHQSTSFDGAWNLRFQREVNGYGAQLAFCHVIGVEWEPKINVFHYQPDVAPDWDISCTHLYDGCLIVRDNEPDDRKYVLVVARYGYNQPTFEIIGAINGVDAKKDKYLRDPGATRASWFVPAKDLKSIHEMVG